MTELTTIGGATGVVATDDLAQFVADGARRLDLDGRSVCVIVPDGTRSCPLAEVLAALREALIDRVSKLTVLVALGTHQPMSGQHLTDHLGKDVVSDPRIEVLNHEWWEPSTFATLGEITAAEISAASAGQVSETVPVRVNRAVVEHDVALVVGPVFPHEVIGFSGGNKYFFPGVSGPEVINITHWIGALITSSAIIGVPGVTPVRSIVNRAAEMIPSRRLCLALVVASGTHDASFAALGTPEDAWEAAAAVSAHTHVRYLDRPVRRVLSLIPDRYDDLWTAAKGMYKVDPIVADGGEVVIYAPHVQVASETHGENIALIGYHCRDYFLGQPGKFDDIPRGVIAHSTHLRGTGTYDPVTGEKCRITVTLATGIDEETTRALALSYRDPDSIDSNEWARDPDTMVVPNAGEVLFRLRS